MHIFHREVCSSHYNTLLITTLPPTSKLKVVSLSPAWRTRTHHFNYFSYISKLTRVQQPENNSHGYLLLWTVAYSIYYLYIHTHSTGTMITSSYLFALILTPSKLTAIVTCMVYSPVNSNNCLKKKFKKEIIYKNFAQFYKRVTYTQST